MKTTRAFSKILALKKPIKVIQGGTSGSKTYSIMQILNYIAENSRRPRIITVATDTTPNLKTGAIRDFMNIRGEAGVWSDKSWNATDKIYKFENAIIEFIAFDRENKARGGRRDILFLNECNRLTYEIFNQLSIRTKESVYLDYNPTVEFWIHDKGILKLVSVDFLKVNYLDNEELDQRIIDKIEEKKPIYDAAGNLLSGDPVWWRVYGLGELGVYEGLIFKIGQHWTEEEKPPEAKLIAYGLDFGYSNDPTTLVGIYYANGSYFLQEIFYQTGLTNLYRDDMTDEEKENTIQYKLEYLGISKTELIVADSAEPKSIEDLRRLGYNVVGAVKGKDSVVNGIDYIQSQNIFITPSSVNGLKEARSYCWAVNQQGKRLNKPQDLNNHFWDAVRYGFSHKVQIEIKKRDEWKRDTFESLGTSENHDVGELHNPFGI